MTKMEANTCERIAQQLAAEGWLIAVRKIDGHDIPWLLISTRGNGTFQIIHSDDITAAFTEMRRISRTKLC